MTISLELVDKDSKVHLFIIRSMLERFVQDYAESGEIANKKFDTTDDSLVADMSRYDRYHFIKVDNEYAGFIALEAYHNTGSTIPVAYVSDEIYVEKKFRNKNVASDARELMRVTKNQKRTPMLGSNISYRRARRLAQYFKQQNYKYIYYRTNSTATVDDSLCLIAYDIVPDNVSNMFPIHLPLSNMSVDRLYRKVNKQYRKFLLSENNKYK
jgi:hypothetical protein